MTRGTCGASLAQQQGSRWDVMTPMAACISPSGSICTESRLVPSATTDGGKVRQRARGTDGAGTQSSRDPIPHSSTETLSHPTSGPITTLLNVISKLPSRGQLKVPQGRNPMWSSSEFDPRAQSQVSALCCQQRLHLPGCKLSSWRARLLFPESPGHPAFQSPQLQSGIHSV